MAYVVMQSIFNGDYSHIQPIAVFLDEDQANAYVETKECGISEQFWIEEVPLSSWIKI